MARKPEAISINYIIHDLSEEERREYLPYLYGYPWYKWSWDFFNSKNKNSFLCAANQIGKSSALIRKTIEWATNKDLWPTLWATKPTQFWYLYPNKDMATIEFQEKWVKEFLPNAILKHHPTYGWSEKFEYGKIHHIAFNSGVTVYFKSYEQTRIAMQGSTVYFIACDEELPVQFWPEINARRFAIDGYFASVFTATIGQKFWHDTIERIGESDERFPSAFKRQVSMFDCLKYYKSDKKTPWTKKRVKEVIESCESDSEVQRRVYGKFILDRNVLYNSFDKTKIICERLPNLEGYVHFLAIYIGKENMTALAHVAVSEDRTKIYLVDYFQKRINPIGLFLEFRIIRNKTNILMHFINESANDFIDIASSAGEFFVTTKASEDGSEKLLNSLFHTSSFKILKGAYLDDLVFQLEAMKLKSVDNFSGYELIGAIVTCVDNLKFDFKKIIDGSEIKLDNGPKIGERMRYYKGLDRLEDDTNDTLDSSYKEINDQAGNEGGGFEFENF